MLVPTGRHLSTNSHFEGGSGQRSVASSDRGPSREVEHWLNPKGTGQLRIQLGTEALLKRHAYIHLAKRYHEAMRPVLNRAGDLDRDLGLGLGRDRQLGLEGCRDMTLSAPTCRAPWSPPSPPSRSLFG